MTTSYLIPAQLQRIGVGSRRTGEVCRPGQGTVDVDALLSSRIPNQHVAPLTERNTRGAIKLSRGTCGGLPPPIDRAVGLQMELVVFVL